MAKTQGAKIMYNNEQIKGLYNLFKNVIFKDLQHVTFSNLYTFCQFTGEVVNDRGYDIDFKSAFSTFVMCGWYHVLNDEGDGNFISPTLEDYLNHYHAVRRVFEVTTSFSLPILWNDGTVSYEQFSYTELI